MSYNPTIGRWISEDPIGFQAADPNLFRYVGNNPTNFVDPSGLDADLFLNPGGSAGSIDMHEGGDPDWFEKFWRRIHNAPPPPPPPPPSPTPLMPPTNVYGAPVFQTDNPTWLDRVFDALANLGAGGAS